MGTPSPAAAWARASVPRGQWQTETQSEFEVGRVVGRAQVAATDCEGCAEDVGETLNVHGDRESRRVRRGSLWLCPP